VFQNLCDVTLYENEDDDGRQREASWELEVGIWVGEMENGSSLNQLQSVISSEIGILSEILIGILSEIA
jgi:hypothetical protein